MRTKALCVTGAVAVLLSGCGMLKKEEAAEVRPSGAKTYNAPNQTCETHQSECNLTVVVDPRCKIHVVPKIKTVKGRSGGALMVWTIQGDATFQPGKGIRWKQSSPAAAQVFRTQQMKPFSSRWEERNSTRKGEFEYAVNVIQDGKPCPEFDPSIVNEW